MGIIKAICISRKRGTAKQAVPQADFLVNWGIDQDAHAGKWHRQVSLLSYEKIQEFRKRGAEIEFGAFGENLVVEGFDFKSLPVGTRFRCGEVLLEMTQIGKECHSHCEIYQRMGDCIMPREGVFAAVLEGGTIRVGDEMELIPDNLYQTLADRDPSCSCILSTVLSGSHQGERILWMDGVARWSTPAASFLKRHKQELLSSTGSRLLTLEDETVFNEIIGSRKNLVICGAGHVSIPLILLGRRIGFHVTVIDDRPYFADQARRAEADEVYCEEFAHALQQIPGSYDTYFVIVTRGHRYDITCLRMALAKQNAYIGMIGSRKRVALVRQQLAEEGISQELLDQVHAPIGLAIHAETPDEIAVSIMAEIIQEKNSQKRISSYDKELLACLTDRWDGRKAILCTIVSKKGSAPRDIGTKMVIWEDGTLVGTIGGGCAESSIIQKGRSMMREDVIVPVLEEVDMTGQDAEEDGMVCGGRIWVYMERVW
jgi:xanthine/CO dehydrogenase XdhC/CoxF family maturation factor/MOSC domain-containing protein YiiM